MNIIWKAVLILGLPVILLAEDMYVKKINIEGNKRTKDYIIRRELTLKPGDVFVETLLEENSNQLYNMGIFSEVKVSHEAIEDSIVVNIVVKERLFIIPFPLVEYNDDFGWSYGGGAYINNLSGRNQKVKFEFELGALTEYSLEFNDPWLTGDRISLHVEISRKEYDHPYEDYHVLQRSVSAEIGQRWNNYNWWYTKVGFRRMDLDTTGITKTGTDYDLIPYLLITYFYDSSDIWVNPSRGWRCSAKIGQYGYPFHFPDFRRIEVSAGKFIRVPVGRTVGLNLSYGEKHGSLPEYEEYYVGSASSIRGLPKAFDHASHFLIGSAEYRFDIIKSRPIIPKLDAGLGGVLFYDNGTVWSRGESVFDKEFYSGFGMGLRFFVPFIDVARLDIGWTTDGSYRLHAVAGSKF